VEPGSIYVGRNNKMLTSSLYDSLGRGMTPLSIEDNTWSVVSLIYNKNTNGSVYINGELKKNDTAIYSGVKPNDCSIVIGGATDYKGSTKKTEQSCHCENSETGGFEQDIIYDTIKPSINNMNDPSSPSTTSNIKINTNGKVSKVGSYYIIIFKDNGTITFNCNNCGENKKTVNGETLITGGGGGGGYSRGAMEGSGGGGAGRTMIENITYQINKKYNIVIGKGGGSGVNGNSTYISDSNNSILIEAIGGGRGGNGQGGWNSTGISINNEGHGGGGQGWGTFHLGGIPTKSDWGHKGGVGTHFSRGGGGGGGGGQTSDGIPYDPFDNNKNNGGNGGEGITWTYTPGIVYSRGGGGGQPVRSTSIPGLPNGGNLRNNGQNGVNPGDGGGGGGSGHTEGGSGANGVYMIAVHEDELKYSYSVNSNRKLYKEKPVLSNVEVDADLDPNMYLDGDICEIIAYSTNDGLSAENRTSIEEYLAIKWGLTGLPVFSTNTNILNKKQDLNIGKDNKYLSYNANDNIFKNVDGSDMPQSVWSYDNNKKIYTIDFKSAYWSVENGDYMKNACNWAQKNYIYWDSIATNCNDLGIPLQPH
jgi:hypothetical protein